MISRRVTVLLPGGIHAGIAHHLCKGASLFASSIFLSHHDSTVSLKSIPGVLSLAIHHGDEIEFLADGDDELPAIAAMVYLLEGAADEDRFYARADAKASAAATASATARDALL